eukprot:CAMPEP_0184367764 /NCGR_PEP_ID=MMETSP1089-20130417/159772_1 /TAXON_ID=38269 ORGANISM="Gloeochaete wittrockiana, Strain SAG46.84" /NCGR_SAMPLE_ID=MMETSP1089 /ASSEMBLY_ACC=CAM_ASM_000445 /LENGTH=36 /DNA_ID= /DNA_START= /DNA_END= /DNA_ORIENTATION=
MLKLLKAKPIETTFGHDCKNSYGLNFGSPWGLEGGK